MQAPTTDTLTFIREHRNDDVRKLALGRIPAGVDAQWALQQIEGIQTAARKLPTWVATDGIWWPQRLSLEQCSSEVTALYKRQLALSLLPQAEERSVLTDAGKIYVVSCEPVEIVTGAADNIKITYPGDIGIAEAIYSGRNCEDAD